MKKTKNELNIIKDDANKKAEIEQELSVKVAELLKAKDELEEKNNVIKDLKNNINHSENMKEIINKYKQEVQYLKNELIKKVKKELTKQNLLKIKKEKNTLIYLLLYLKYILIIIRKN